MKIKYSCILIIVFISIIEQNTSTNVFASPKTTTNQSTHLTEEQIVAKKFKPLIAKFSLFFKSKPRALIHTVSEYQNEYMAIMYILNNVTYDIQKTISITTPYIGYINLTMNEYDCTDSHIGMDSHFEFHNTIDNILPDIYKDECYSDKYWPDEYQFVFIYGDDEWRLKSITIPPCLPDKYGNLICDETHRAERLITIFGIKNTELYKIITDSRGIEFNKNIINFYDSLPK
jgi:hypothetical protein